MVLAGRDLCHFQHPCATSRPPGPRAKIVPRWGCHVFRSWVKVDVLWWASCYVFFAVLLAQKLQRNLSTRLHNLKRKMCNFYYFFFFSSPFTFFIVSSNQRRPVGDMPRCTRLPSTVVWPDSHQRPPKENKQHAFGGGRKTVRHDSALTAAESAHFQAVNLGVRHFSDKGGTERKYCAGRERKRRTTRLQPCGVA